MLSAGPTGIIKLGEHVKRGTYRMTFGKKITRSEREFGPGREYVMSGAHFWYYYLNAMQAVDCYEKLDPEKGPYDDIESGPCVVVGCGPSLKDFPFEVLKDWDCIVCNRAHEWVPWAAYFITMDYGAFIESPDQGKRLRQFKQLVFTKVGGEAIHPNAVEFPWPSKTPMVSDSIAEGMHGRHSGMAAVNLAYCLGYNPIYFLGIDCKVDYESNSEGRPHFYDEENEKLRNYIMRPVDGYTAERLGAWRQMFDCQARQYRFRDVEVINLGPNSALRKFEKQDWREVLRCNV